MKYKLPFLVGLASLAALVGVQAQTAVTDPVGYITTDLAPNAAGTTTGADTLVAPTLVQQTTFAGASSNDPSGATSITFASGVPATLDGSYYVEIKSGARAGFWSTVVSSTATSITTSDTLPAGLAAGTNFIVRKHATIGNYLGANTPGLTAFTGANNADKVLVLNPVTQVVTAYVYAAGGIFGPNAGWYDQVTEASADNVIIYPGDAVKIRRVSNGPISFVTVGYVKTTPTEIDIYERDNWLNPMLATGTTLAGTNLNTGNTASGLFQEDYNAANGAPDRVFTISSAQVTTSYVALTGAGGFIDEVTETGAGTLPLKEGTGIIIRRDPRAPATFDNSIWVAPAQVIAN
ncbi:MAG: hypothetical protein V4675_06870 [Verrucomicrobiota bacterium]